MKLCRGPMGPRGYARIKAQTALSEYVHGSKTANNLALHKFQQRYDVHFHTTRPVWTPKRSMGPGRLERSEAQTALLEYLHGTRNLPYNEAEYISMNSPCFIKKCLGKVGSKDRSGEDIGKLIERLFLFDPMNEFEPFFESLGLKESEVLSSRSRMMFLNEEELFMKNYYALCKYGFSRGEIGKMLKKMMEVFKNEEESVLLYKLKGYEDLGLSKSSVIRVVGHWPSLLIGENVDFASVVQDVGWNWLEGQLSESFAYNWRDLLGYTQLLKKDLFSKKDFGKLLKNGPSLLVDGSNGNLLPVIETLLRFGVTLNKISTLFFEVHWHKECFVKNLKWNMQFLVDIGIRTEDIGRLACSHFKMLGSQIVKENQTSLVTSMIVGEEKLTELIKKNPTQFENLVKNALEIYNNKETCFDLLERSGLSREVVYELVKIRPGILSLKKHLLEEKIDLLINVLGYPISSIVTYPRYLSIPISKIKRRFSMCEWLKNQGLALPPFEIILSHSDELFLRSVLTCHPEGLKTWKEMNKTQNLLNGNSADEYQKNLECLVDAGLSREDVSNLVKTNPHILAKNTTMLKAKLDLLVNGVRYPSSHLLKFPGYLDHAIPKIKLRFSFYNWLRSKGALKRTLYLGVLLNSTEKDFVKSFVERHPEGLTTWEELKKKTRTIHDSIINRNHDHLEEEMKKFEWNKDAVRALFSSAMLALKCRGTLHGSQSRSFFMKTSMAMRERGINVSHIACKSKLYEVINRYKRLNELLAEVTTCTVVKDPKLLDSIPELTNQMKDEVRKILNWECFLYDEIHAYLNAVKSPEDLITGEELKEIARPIQDLVIDENCDHLKEGKAKKIEWNKDTVRTLFTVGVLAQKSERIFHGSKPECRFVKISMEMKERGINISRMQCKKKFYNVISRYMRLNAILEEETCCKVVKNPKLLDSIPELTDQMKDEVRKTLNWECFPYEEIHAYQNAVNSESFDHKAP